jgi:hypothetical protein
MGLREGLSGHARRLPERPAHREPRAPDVSESAPEQAAGSPDTQLRMSG